MAATKDVTAKTVVGQTETFAAWRDVKLMVFLWCGVKVRREGRCRMTAVGKPFDRRSRLGNTCVRYAERR